MVCPGALQSAGLCRPDAWEGHGGAAGRCSGGRRRRGARRYAADARRGGVHARVPTRHRVQVSGGTGPIVYVTPAVATITFVDLSKAHNSIVGRHCGRDSSCMEYTCT
eukprot:351691-Chlamydomonas_euryale.AAC.3